MNQSMPDTSQQQIREIFQKQVRRSKELSKSSVKNRIKKLDSIYKYLTEKSNEQNLKKALYTDLRKPEVEVLTSELGIILSSIKHIKANLRNWVSPKSVATPLLMFGAKSYIHYEAKGVSLIISPWNYPFQLSINPLLYAISAGCPAILKPSEYSSASSQYIAQMINELFDESEVAVCQGGVSTSTNLLKLPFNHIYFTGSPAVGRIVMKAAAENLSSITLELGGKSPCIIDENVDIKATAKKLVWGKFFNTGQTCIAPDYVLIHKNKVDEISSALKSQISSMYNIDGKGIQSSPYFGRIINKKHFDGLIFLLNDAKEKGAKVIVGGDYDADALYIAPTVLTNAGNGALILEEEIFGPILPILTYETLDEALNYINNKPKPLAFYIISRNSKFINYVINNTSAGGTVINDFLIHFANHFLPFGGINNSGIGKSHGKAGFIGFSNERGIMKNKFALTSLMHPPYGKLARKIAGIMGKWI